MPKVLWMSPYSLHDTSSGASVDAKCMLQFLVKRGVEVWSCASFVFDNYAGTVAFGNLKERLATTKDSIFTFDDKGIHYVYTRCEHTEETMMSLDESELFFQTYLRVLDAFQPDIVFGYCPGVVSLTCFAEARRRGIATAYRLVNGNHRHSTFSLFDLVFTDSFATAAFYQQCTQVNVVSTGAFFEPEVFLSKEHKPEFITMINPVSYKGLSIMTKIIDTCQREMPELKFLLLNTRGNFLETIAELHDKDSLEAHPYVNSHFSNVYLLGAQTDMRPVYAVTKALVAPSLWFESWGRVTTEAVLNGIPVLTSTSGGLPEAIAGGGISLEAPEHCRNDHLSLPTDEEIRPWIDALQRLLNEDWTQKLEQAKQTLNVEHATDRVLEAFDPFFHRCKKATTFAAHADQALQPTL